MNAAGRRKRSDNFVTNRNSTIYQEDFHERKKRAAKVNDNHWKGGDILAQSHIMLLEFKYPPPKLFLIFLENKGGGVALIFWQKVSIHQRFLSSEAA